MSTYIYIYRYVRGTGYRETGERKSTASSFRWNLIRWILRSPQPSLGITVFLLFHFCGHTHSLQVVGKSCVCFRTKPRLVGRLAPLLLNHVTTSFEIYHTHAAPLPATLFSRTGCFVSRSSRLTRAP